MNNYLRPDEEASEAQISKAKKRDQMAKGILNTAASAATGIAGGSLALKVLPFLSEHIPLAIAKKAIDKVAPKIGQFLDSGLGQGLSLESGFEFLKGQFMPEEGKKQAQEKKQNEIGQISQELQTFIEQEVQKGKSPDHAAATAMIKPEFIEITKQIEKQTKKPFPTSIRELYEGKAVNPNQVGGALQNEENGQQVQQGQQGQNQISPRLQQAMQKLGKFVGG